MRKNATLTIFLIMLALLMLSLHSQAQQEHVTSFFADVKRDPVPVTFKIDSIKNVFVFGEHIPANGAIKKTGEGYEITIDREFYAYYFGKSQIKRLVYFLLAHEVLGLPKGKGIMNENLVYSKLKTKTLNVWMRKNLRSNPAAL